MDEWGKLWDIATAGMPGDPAKIIPDNADPWRVTLEYDTGEEVAYFWEEGEWQQVVEHERQLAE